MVQVFPRQRHNKATDGIDKFLEHNFSVILEPYDMALQCSLSKSHHLITYASFTNEAILLNIRKYVKHIIKLTRMNKNAIVFMYTVCNLFFISCT